MISIAIIITLYNRERSIVASVESALEQDYPHKEIIIVNDGSTDQSAEKLLPYLDQVTLINQQNAGPGAAKNAGVSHAKSKYLIFLDSDDVLPHKNVLNDIAEKLDAGYDFISYLKIKKLDKNGLHIDSIDAPEDIKAHILNSPLNYPGLPPYCLNTDLYNKAGGMACQPWGDAMNFWREYMNNIKRPTYINDVGYFYDLSGDDNVSKGGGKGNSIKKRNNHIIDAISFAYNNHKNKMVRTQKAVWLIFILGYSINSNKKSKDYIYELLKLNIFNFMLGLVYIYKTKLHNKLTSKFKKKQLKTIEFFRKTLCNVNILNQSFLYKKRELKSNIIIINSTANNNFNFNSKFFFEYLLNENVNLDCYFVINDIEKRTILNSIYPGRFISNTNKGDIDLILSARTWVCSTIDMPLSFTLKHKKRIVYHFGHGVPLKNIGFGEIKISLLRKLNRYICMRNISHSVCYSDAFRDDMKKMFLPLTPEFVSLGQPRNDSLSPDNAKKIDEYIAHLSVKKKVLYCPTWRSYENTKFFPFNDLNSEILSDFLESEEIVIILREHPYYRSDIPKQILMLERVIVLNADLITDFTPYLSDMDVVITDYSSIYFDVIANRSTDFIFIPYDIEKYASRTGFSMDYNQLTPGPKISSMLELIENLKSNGNYDQQKEYLIKLFNIKVQGNNEEHYKKIIKLL